MSWGPCEGYSMERVHALFAGRESVTPLEVLKASEIPPPDRLWVVLRKDVLDEDTLRLLACDFAEMVLPLYESRYPRDMRPRNAIQATRAWVRDQDAAGATEATWTAARAAAWAATRATGDAARAAEATWTAARAAARAVAWATARDAAWTAAWAAAGGDPARAVARATARDVAWTAAWDAACAAARAAQVDATIVRLTELENMDRRESETPDPSVGIE